MGALSVSLCVALPSAKHLPILPRCALHRQASRLQGARWSKHQKQRKLPNPGRFVSRRQWQNSALNPKEGNKRKRYNTENEVKSP